MRAHAPRLLTLACVMAVLLAGCGAPAAVDESDDPALVVEGEKDRITRDNSTGDLIGRVHDVRNQSIAGARISIIDTALFTETDEEGRFEVTVPAGTLHIRVAAQEFLAVERNVHVPADKVVEIAVQLSYADGRTGDLLAHEHDYWRGQDTYVLMDEAVEVHENRGAHQVAPGLEQATWYVVYANTAQKGSYEIHLPEGSATHPSIVLPGTGRIDVTLEWDTQDIAAERIGVSYVSADTSDRVDLDAGPSGHTHSFVVRPEMADSGHQLWTFWRFFVWLDNDAASATDWDPTVMQGPIHVRIVLTRSAEPPLEPGHPDFWGKNTSLRLMDESAVHRDGTICCGIKDSFSFGIQLPAGVLVPPGTTRLEFHFRWSYSRDDVPVLDKEHALRWRTGDQDPHKTSYEDLKTASPVDTGDRLKVYEIHLADGESDQYYYPKSNWLWVPYQVGEEDVPNNVEKSARDYTLAVVAYRD